MNTDITTRIAITLTLTCLTVPAFADSDDGNVCDFVAETATATQKKLQEEEWGAHRSSEFVRDYLVNKPAWASGATAPVLADGDNVFNGAGRDYYERHIRWSHDMGYLPYVGRWYKILSHTDSGASRGARSTGAFLSAVLGTDGLVCAFDNEVVETSTASLTNWRREKRSGSFLDCEQAIEPENELFADKPLSEAVITALTEEMGKDFYEGQFRRNSYIQGPVRDGKRSPGPVLRVDINNDGRDENLLSVNYSEADSTPCGSFYYDLLSDDMTKLGDPQLREALFAAQDMEFRDDGQRQINCGRSYGVVSVDGKNYMSSRRKLARKIVAIESGEPVELCRSTFAVKPKVVYDASKVPSDLEAGQKETP